MNIPVRSFSILMRQQIYSGSMNKPKSYSPEEAFESSLEYFNGDDMAAKKWVEKYSLKDLQGNILEKNLDKEPNQVSIDFCMPLHDNLRGDTCYG